VLGESLIFSQNSNAKIIQFCNIVVN